MLINPIAFSSPYISSEVSLLGDYYHVSYSSSQYDVKGSGFAKRLETAKKIAFSELNERYLVFQLLKQKNKKNRWGFEFDQSCSGFSVGYSEQKTILRSICEGVERWALSKWIDDGYALCTPSISVSEHILKSSILKSFDRINLYYVNVPLVISDLILNVYVSVFLGWKGRGVYAGYGAKTELQSAIDHASVEAIRNLLIYKNQVPQSHFPYNRIQFFANNGSHAIDSIQKTKIKLWPTPTLQFNHREKFGDFWLARTIFEGWDPWQNGGEARFLY